VGATKVENAPLAVSSTTGARPKSGRGALVETAEKRAKLRHPATPVIISRGRYKRMRKLELAALAGNFNKRTEVRSAAY
jgi:hypothetical protein